ncbi:family 43 glycosylhydrolase [Longimicrobium sp.]|uniref:family 43 glycosylhydrolase n=1 Tax=Longimicrobium sp. TaxID=2029185 RepID=UPI003B3A4443
MQPLNPPLMHRLRLPAPADAPFAFDVVTDGEGFTVTGPDPSGQTATATFRLRERTHNGWLDLFAAIAPRFGTRVPRNRQPAEVPTFTAPYRPLLTENLSAEVLHGYGDPAVLRVGEWWYLVATSNDAPDSFPIARSRDLRLWELRGFVFPRGHKPAWAADGEGVSDFWAAEMHRMGGEYRVYFSAREKDGHDLAIGVATAPTPEGPWTTPDQPLLRGGVIDPHVVVDDRGAAYLLWKDDSNDVWPSLLNGLLHDHARLIAELLPDQADQRSASLLATLWPWICTREPMERFFVQQLLIEVVTDDFTAVRERLRALQWAEEEPEVRRPIRAVLDAMRTPVWAEWLSPDGRSLLGERTLVMANDQEWEAHLIEGVWITRHGGKYYAFYAGNDFSTARYGIGAAVADAPLGPYRKLPEPLLRSTAEWWGPGHPSVAEGPDGEPWLFLHAFFPGETGYNEFRALLAVPLVLDGEGVSVRSADEPRPARERETQTTGEVR